MPGQCVANQIELRPESEPTNTDRRECPCILSCLFSMGSSLRQQYHSRRADSNYGKVEISFSTPGGLIRRINLIRSRLQRVVEASILFEVFANFCIPGAGATRRPISQELLSSRSSINLADVNITVGIGSSHVRPVEFARLAAAPPKAT